MEPDQNKLFTARARILLAFIALLVPEAVGACGQARSRHTDSETHWLLRCDSDLDCGERSCECGVCSKSCVASTECASLGISNVECVPSASCESGADASSSSTGAVCLLPCDVDADCSELGAGATCRSQRCEVSESVLGAGEAIPPASMLANTAVETLCDGSQEVRVAYVISRVDLDGAGRGTYHYFAQSYGDAFFAIDGQCRFWQGRFAGGQVHSGTLSADAAQALAVEIGLGHVSERVAYDGRCVDGSQSVLWTQEGSIRCNCNCGEYPEVRAANRALSELFVSGQPLNGPAQLGLAIFGADVSLEAQLWPLERAPRANERVEVWSSTGSISLNERSGVLMTDATELILLRFARNFYQGSTPGSDYTPMVWTNPETGNLEGFDMMLRDEVPAHVRDALDAVRAP
jgi:hypothetical protein